MTRLEGTILKTSILRISQTGAGNGQDKELFTAVVSNRPALFCARSQKTKASGTGSGYFEFPRFDRNRHDWSAQRANCHGNSIKIAGE